MTPGFTKAEILRPAKDDPRAPGGVFERVGRLLSELLERSVTMIGLQESLAMKYAIRRLRRSLRWSCSSPSALALSAAAPRAEIIEQILVKVNGEIFTKTDLEDRQVAALRQMGQQIDPKTDPTDAQLRKMLDEVTPQLLVNVVDEMLLVQRGRSSATR